MGGGAAYSWGGGGERGRRGRGVLYVNDNRYRYVGGGEVRGGQCNISVMPMYHERSQCRPESSRICHVTLWILFKQEALQGPSIRPIYLNTAQGA